MFDSLSFWIAISLLYAILIVMILRLAGFKGIKREPIHDDPSLRVSDCFAAAPVGYPSYHKGHYIRTEVSMPCATPIQPTLVRSMGGISIRQRIPDTSNTQIETAEIIELKETVARYRRALELIRESDQHHIRHLCDVALKD